MTGIAPFLLAIALSADAFVAATARAAAGRGRVGLMAALGTGALFASVEALTPLAGWAAGLAASSLIAAVDHWIAFALLGLVGGRMALNALQAPAEGSGPRLPGRPALLLLTALATSLDATAVGVSLGVMQAPILPLVASMAAATLMMATLGSWLGQRIGPRLGQWAELAGGLTLAALGCGILAQHILLA